MAEYFPTHADNIRIKQEQKWLNMFNSIDSGNRRLSFDHATGKIKQEVVNPVIPLPATVSDIYSDLLFGEFPNINPQAENEELKNIFDEWADRNSLDTAFLEAASLVSAQGTGFLRFFKEDGETYFDFVKSSDSIWTETYKGITNIKIIENREFKKNQSELWYEIQEHELTEITENVKRHAILHYYIVTETNTGIIKEIIEIEQPIITGYNFLPIVKITNIGNITSNTGRSDYKGKEQLFSEIDNRIDQNNNILEENADPWIAVPSGILDRHGQFNKRNGKWFEKTISGGPGENAVDIISYGAESLTPAMEHIKQMIEMLFFSSRISAPIAGLDKGGNVESGRALKWKSINTMSMISRKRKYWEKAIKDFVYKWALLNDLDIEKRTITIEWKDGLPLDDSEVIENTIKMVSSKIMSREKGIEKAQEITKEETKEEYTKIEAEETERINRETSAIGQVVTI